MEIGKVKVLHKGGDSGKCGNYRPLTMLSIPCKIAESIICDTIDPRLNEMLQKNHAVGIQKGSVVRVTPPLLHAIFIDFKKAFDSVYVNHDILHYKMHACGLSERLFCGLQSYISSRRQFAEF